MQYPVVFGFVSLLVNCGYPTAYSVGVVGYEGQRQHAAAVDDAHRWETAVGNRESLSLDVHDGCVASAPTNICVFLMTPDEWRARAREMGFDPALLGRTVGGSDWVAWWDDVAGRSPACFINVGAMSSPMAVSHVVQHEIGHAMGLRHAPPGTVMFWLTAPNVDVQPDSGGAQNVTCLDVDQYVRLRGLPNECKGE